MRARPLRRWIAGAVLSGLVGLSAALGAIRPADAAPLSADEREHLEAGQVVRRGVDVELDGEPHFGGVSYVVVRAPAEAVLDALGDVAAYPELFPFLIEAREVARDGDRWIRFLHRTKLGPAEYTVRVRTEPGGIVRFWLDPSFPSDVDDLWGYFRVEPLGPERSLVTYAALVRVTSIVRVLFQEKLRSIALGTPRHMQRYMERRAVASRGPRSSNERARMRWPSGSPALVRDPSGRRRAPRPEPAAMLSADSERSPAWALEPTRACTVPGGSC